MGRGGRVKMKVCQFMNKNQFELRGEGKICLQSYDSLVVEIKATSKGIAWHLTIALAKILKAVVIVRPNSLHSLSNCVFKLSSIRIFMFVCAILITSLFTL